MPAEAEATEASPALAYSGTPPLKPAYKWCLKAYPKSYWAAFGDDVICLLADIHEGERHASPRECFSILRAGMARRVRLTTLKYWWSVLLFAEAATSLTYVGLAIRAIREQPRAFSTSGQYAFFRDADAVKVLFTLRTGWFLAYLLPLVALAGLLTWMAVRAACRVHRQSEDQPRQTRIERAVVLAQPLLLVPAALGPGFYQPSSGFLALAVALVFVGTATIVARRRLLRPSGPLTIGVAIVVLALPWLSLVSAASDLHGSPGMGDYNFAAGFTNEIAVPTRAVTPLGVSCASPDHCVVFGISIVPMGYGSDLGHEQFQVIASTSNGRSWATVPFSTNRGLVDLLPTPISCPTSQLCYLSAGGFEDAWPIERSTNGGATWETLPAGSPFSVSPYDHPATMDCPSPNECILAGGDGIAVSHNAGASWQVGLRTPPGALVAGFNVLSCADALHCAYVLSIRTGSQGSVMVYSTSDGGDRWMRHRLAADTGVSSEIACPADLTCLVGGTTKSGGSALWTTVDGGASWVQHKAPTQLLWLTCPSSRSCWAIAGWPGHESVLSSVDAGSSWRVLDAPPRFSGGQIACGSPSLCTAIGFTLPDPSDHGVVVSTSDGGRSWVEVPTPKLPPQDHPRPDLLN